MLAGIRNYVSHFFFLRFTKAKFLYFACSTRKKDENLCSIEWVSVLVLLLLYFLSCLLVNDDFMLFSFAYFTCPSKQTLYFISASFVFCFFFRLLYWLRSVQALSIFRFVGTWISSNWYWHRESIRI